MAQVPPGNLDVAVFGQLPPTQLALGNPFKVCALEVICFQVALGSWSPSKALEHAPWDPAPQPSEVKGSSASERQSMRARAANTPAPKVSRVAPRPVKEHNRRAWELHSA
jgi:hypothetical protein